MLEVRGIISRSLNKVIFLLFIGLLVMYVGLLPIAGLPAPALAQMSDITPNGIEFLSEADTLMAGQTFNITVQILYNGGPLRSEGVRVYLLANDTSIIPAELGIYVITDKNGIANYTVTTNKTGDVKLTAYAMNTNSRVSAEKKFHVIEGPVATPTATTAPSPSPTPTPTPTPEPSANATVTAVPSVEPTPTATPTIAPTITAAPTSPPPSGDANAQAIGIITAGIIIAVILIVLVLVARTFKKK